MKTLENSQSGVMLSEIENLAARLIGAKSIEEKLSFLNADPLVASVSSHFMGILQQLSMEKQLAMKQLIAIGQVTLSEIPSKKDIEDLSLRLVQVDDFYREIGGIVGYQAQVLKLLDNKKTLDPDVRYHSPHFIDISHETNDVRLAIEEGIRAMPMLCEMYPLGGAADRLHLIDEKTGNELPAAKLEFAGKTLLEGLIRDLEAREYLYFQRTGQKLMIPVAVMTSHEKDNWIHVQDILEKNRYFNRPKETFRIFVQPLVPVVDQQGSWVYSAPFKPLLKPGGHGAIWKIAKDVKVFDWFRQMGAKFALIRQINNPLAGIDYGLLAFTGIGASQKKSFGFASCPRLCLSAEGMNVLVERKIKGSYSYVVSNIEYTDFEKYGIADKPLIPNEPYSRFTSNTNILFADLDAIDAAVDRCPFPGLIINLKKQADGKMAGRLESAMQNIADVFVEKKRSRLTKEAHQLKKTFITYNHRHKTISTAKKALSDSGLFNETPENCFYDLMRAHRELLAACQFSLPVERSLEETLAKCPSFVFLFHPAFGPLFQTIAKKLRGGQIQEDSELILDIADADLENLHLRGSLQIRAIEPLGQKRFNQMPRCVLKNVKISNRGVDWEHSRPFWKAQYHRHESLLVILEGHSEFIAENVSFEKDLRFVVKDNERMTVRLDGSVRIEKIK